MNRHALSLSVACTLLMAPIALAEDSRSLGVTVSPLGAYVAATPTVVTSGYAAGIDWAFHRRESFFFVGGHISASQLATEATPVSIRVTPCPEARVRPYLGLGASLLVPMSPGTPGDGGSFLRLGGEASAGIDVRLFGEWFLSAQGRYQNFGLGDSPFSPLRQQLASAYLGLGVTL